MTKYSLKCKFLSFIFCLQIGACSLPLEQQQSSSKFQSGGGSNGEYFGYDHINQTIRERIVRSGSFFRLSDYLVLSFFDSRELVNLLGFYNGSGVEPGFKNGKPNSMNLVLWHLIFDGLVNDIVKHACPETSPVPTPTPIPIPTPDDDGTIDFPTPSEPEIELAPSYMEKVAPLCNWTSESARSDVVLQNLWLATMAFDAPRSEFVTWKNFVQTQIPTNGVTTKQAVHDVLYTIFFNPHFLLRK